MSPSSLSPKTLTIICPVYNEEEIIEEFYKVLKQVLVSEVKNYESTILFVLDKSQDNTLAILKKIASNDHHVRILALSSRFGQQMSLVAGIDHCDSDAVIMMDSDLQHPPEVIPELLAKFEEGHDIVYTIKTDRQEVPWFKRLLSKCFYKAINRISDIPISEHAADFRLISRRVAKIFQTSIRERNQFLRGLMNWVGFSKACVSIKVGARTSGTSKYGLSRLISFGLHGMVSFSKKPLQASIYVGLFMAGFAFLFILVTVVRFFVLASLPSGWATIVILISLFNGVQLIFLGIIGEYLGNIFDEVKGRPHYIVEEQVNFKQGTL
jgi:polyisoprenyl-phosphate glycosyltransferase